MSKLAATVKGSITEAESQRRKSLVTPYIALSEGILQGGMSKLWKQHYLRRHWHLIACIVVRRSVLSLVFCAALEQNLWQKRSDHRKGSKCHFVSESFVRCPLAAFLFCLYIVRNDNNPYHAAWCRDVASHPDAQSFSWTFVWFLWRLQQ